MPEGDVLLIISYWNFLAHGIWYQFFLPGQQGIFFCYISAYIFILFWALPQGQFLCWTAFAFHIYYLLSAFKAPYPCFPRCMFDNIISYHPSISKAWLFIDISYLIICSLMMWFWFLSYFNSYVLSLLVSFCCFVILPSCSLLLILCFYEVSISQISCRNFFLLKWIFCH